jgi:hypothetical protein
MSAEIVIMTFDGEKNAWRAESALRMMRARQLLGLQYVATLRCESTGQVEMSLRGILRGFGLKVGKTTSRTFPARIRALVAGMRRSRSWQRRCFLRMRYWFGNTRSWTGVYAARHAAMPGRAC